MNNLHIQHQNPTLEKIIFNQNCLTSFQATTQKYKCELNGNTKENITVHGIHIRNCRKCDEPRNNQNIPYILKTWKCEEGCNHDYIFIEREPFEYSFMYCFERNISPYFESEIEKEEKRQKQEEFNNLLRDILEIVGKLHLQLVVLKHISLDNIRIFEEDEILKTKIVNLSSAEIGKDYKQYTADINNIGNLFLSIFVSSDRILAMPKEMSKKETYDKKIEFIYNEIKHIKCIEPYKTKLLAHLIFCLLELKADDPKIDYRKTIHQFKRHPFFWDEKDIEDFLRIINSRVDLNDKEKNKVKIQERIKILNEKVNYEKWKERLHEVVQQFVPDVKKGEDHQCNDLIKFIRNKNIHKDDDTDNEDYNELGISSSSCLPTYSDAKKKGKDSKMLRKFFDENGGPIYYFLDTFEDLLYDLFMYFRGMSRHKKIKQFYPTCFLEDVIKLPKQSSKFFSHPHPSQGSKNISLKNSEDKNQTMKKPPKRRAKVPTSSKIKI